MRVTEQIDALNIMGINAPNFLIFPKVTASILINPVLIILSMGFGIFGGYLVAVTSNLFTTQDYLEGIRDIFEGFTIIYALIKTVVFAFIITTISGFEGYMAFPGEAINVGSASTRAVVWSSIMIILFNLILTQLLLS